MAWETLLHLASFGALLIWLLVEIRRWIAASKIPRDQRPPQPPFPWLRFFGHFALYMLIAILVGGILIAIRGVDAP